MAEFSNLPLELLPFIFDHIVRPQHLLNTCLVSHNFYVFAAPRLYERTSIYAWQKDAKKRVVQLFTALAHHPHLAVHVRTLEIRDFPKTHAFETDLPTIVSAGIANCVNLRGVVWTRDGALSAPVLAALQAAPALRALEINGRSVNYDPALLPRFNALASLSIIMPSAAVAGVLLSWMVATGATLSSLTLICKASPVITDALLVSLAPALMNLEYLYITGSPKVSDRGINAIIQANPRGILGLGLEGLHPKFDLAGLAHQCARAGALARLHTITLTVSPHTSLIDWTDAALLLLSASPLTAFNIYATGTAAAPLDAGTLCIRVAAAHPRLTRLAVHRMRVRPAALADVARRCAGLAELFVTVAPGDRAGLGPALEYARALRSLHVNFTTGADAEAGAPAAARSVALELAHACAPTLVQIGCNTRVWQVGRVIRVDDDGAFVSEPQLQPYEIPEVPEQFLVVRA